MLYQTFMGLAFPSIIRDIIGILFYRRVLMERWASKVCKMDDDVLSFHGPGVPLEHPFNNG
jgi:hypothetical protein